MFSMILRIIILNPKFYFHFIIGKIFGISHVVSYLRNPDPLISIKLLRAFGASIGKKTTIKRSLYLDNVYEDKDSKGSFSNLIIGDNCYVGDSIYFDLANNIIIGNNVVISGQVSLITHSDCNRSKYLTNIYPRICKPIIIENDVWIAFGVTLLCGITIESQSVVGAKSLVNETVKRNSFYAGIPAKKIRDIT